MASWFSVAERDARADRRLIVFEIVNRQLKKCVAFRLLALLQLASIGVLFVGVGGLALEPEQAVAQDREQSQVETNEEEIKRLVRQLGAAQFVVREEATQSLWKYGRSAEPFLKEAVRSNDREVEARAKLILDRFRFGIYPETPPATVMIIEQYRTGDREVREKIVQQLVRRGEADVIERLVDLAEDEASRQEVADWVLSQFDETFAPVILKGDYQAVERLLLVAAYDSLDIALCTAFLHKRGRIDEGIAYLKQKLSEAELDPDQPAIRERLLLISLYRAQGRLPELLSEIEQLPEGMVLPRGYLIAMEDWQAWSEWEESQQAIEKSDSVNGLFWIESLSYAAVAHHLAGRTELRDQVVEHVRHIVDENPAVSLYAAEMLFAIDRPEEAIDCHKQRDSMDVFTLLCSQHRYEEAFAELGMQLNDESIRAWFTSHIVEENLETQEGLTKLFELAEVAGQLSLVGEHELAKSGYEGLAELLLSSERPNQAMLREVCRQEFLLGYDELAWSQTERFFRDKRFADNEVYQTDFITRTLNSNDFVIANFWMRVLAEATPDVMERAKEVHDLIALKYVPELDNKAEVLAAFDKALQEAKRWIDNANETRRQLELGLLADSCDTIGLKQLAKRYYQEALEAGDELAAMKLADISREEGAFGEAATRYKEAFARNPQLIAALYMQGHCLIEAGTMAEGEKTQTAAQYLAMPTFRSMQLADSLTLRDLSDDATDVWRQIALSAEPLSSSYSDACGRIGNAINETSPVESSRVWQQVMIGVMKPERNFINQSSYLNMGELIHHSKAKELMERGEVDAAWEHIQLCERFEPASTQIAEDFVPLLTAAGEEAKADELFDRFYQRHLKILEQFPRSALHHNNLAWFSARSERRLDEALEHARAAVELEPTSSNYLDTLAEILFLRGEVTEALELAKRCIEINPDKEHYREQKRRFEDALQ